MTERIKRRGWRKGGGRGLVLLSLTSLMLQAASAPKYTKAAEEGKRAFERGAFAEAVSNWQPLVEVERGREASPAGVEHLMQLAAAYQGLGQQARAVELLEEAVEAAEKLNDAQTIIAVRAKLAAGNALLRQNEAAEKQLREALEEAEKGGYKRLAAGILNDLGNVLRAQGKLDDAAASFDEGVRLARELSDNSLLARLLSNAASTAAQTASTQNAQKAQRLIGEMLAAVESLPASHEKALLLLNGAKVDQKLNLVRAHRSAEQALKIAEEDGDRALQSYALGTLGALYLEDKQFDAALALTRRAIFSAQQAQSPDALYQWDWQAARILKGQGKRDEAIAAYRRAVETLQPIRHDLALGYGNAPTELSFRQSLGPLFFELADLLFARASEAQNAGEVQQLLREARDTVEQLKAVELEDYFQDDCVNTVRAKTESLEKIDAHSAVLYLVPLADRTEVLVSMADGMHRFTAKIGSEALANKTREFRRNLETRTSYAYLEQAQELYDAIFRPVRDLLRENKIETVVFVPDGALQTVPLASLHDGERFLIEEFAVTVTPGLSLMEPRPMAGHKPEVLLSGLSDAVQGFPSLEFVPDELQNVATEFPSEQLLNAAFVTSALEEKLTEEQFSIVHIASHGQFDRNAHNTFVLTYDGKLTLNKLEALIRPSQYRGKPVELLVLSACQTAAGDDRAALGLAGVAVKAGARSAIASLWFVNDQSTAAFISELYDELRQSSNITRAKAVQAAQVKMLHDRRFRHPCYWAPYLLIGNWL